jgi:hypothetical protein
MTTRLSIRLMGLFTVVALGIVLGLFATDFSPVRGQGKEDDPIPHPNHECISVNCWDVQTYVGGLCGWCTGGSSSNWYKCMPGGTNVCNEYPNLGTKVCTGVCSEGGYETCQATYHKCAQ